MSDDLTQDYGAELGTANEQLRTLLTTGTDVIETPGVTVTPDPNDPNKTITTITEPLPRRTELVGDGDGQVRQGRVTESETVTDQPIVSAGGTATESGTPSEPAAQPQARYLVTDPRINGGNPTPFDDIGEVQKAAGSPEPIAKIEEINPPGSPSPLAEELHKIINTAEQKDAAKNFVDLLNIPVEHLAGFITKGDVTQTATPDELGAQILAPVVGKLGEMLDEKQLGMLTTAVGILGMAVIDPMNPALAAGQVAKATKQLQGKKFKDAVALLKDERGSFQPVPGGANPYGSGYSTKKQAGATTDPEKVAAIKAAAMRHPYSMEEAEQVGKLDAVFQEKSTAFTEEMQKQRRAPRPDTVVETESSDLQQRWNGILNFAPGTSLTDAQAKAAQRTFESASEIVQLTAKAVQRDGYTPQGIEAFAQQFSTARHNLIMLLGGEREAGATLRQFRTDLTTPAKTAGGHVAGEEKLPRISDPYQQQMLDFFLKQEELAKTNPNAVTVKQIIDQIAELPDKATLAQLILQADKPGFWDVWTEQWINSLLSGLAPVKNIVGNPTILAGQIATRGVAAGIDSIGTGMVRFFKDGKAPRDVYMGEVGQMLYGAVEAMGDGFALAWKAFKENQPQMRGQSVEPFRVSATSEYLNMTGLMGRMTDYVSSASGRSLLAGDELAKAMAYRAELRALALRKGYQEVYAKGLEGVAAANHIQDVKRSVLSNPMHYPEIHRQAEDFAIYVTLQKELGEAGKTIQHFATTAKLDEKSWIGAFPVGRFLLPFTTIAINSPKMMGEYTGLARATIRQEIAAGGARKDIALAKLATGVSFMAVMGGLAAQGLITGTGPRNPQAKQQWMDETGKMPNAFYDPISQKYRSTAGLEPYNTIMGAVADIVDIYSHASTETLREKATAAVEALAIAVSNNVGSKSYLKGAAGSMNAVLTGDIQSFEQYAKRTIPGMVTPYSGALRQVEQGIDPVMREALDLIDALKKDIPVLSETLPPELNGLGRIIIRDGGFWNPFYAGVGTPEDQEVLAVLDQHGVILPKVKPMIDGVPLNVWEYHAYQEFATKGLAQDLKGALVGQGSLTDRDVERVTASIVNAHHTEGKWAFLESQAMSDKTRTRLNDANKRREAGERMTPSPFLPGRLPSGTTAPGGLTR